MEQPRGLTVRGKSRRWEPTLTQVAERANRLWHQDGCPATSELGYWMRAKEQLKQEHVNLVATEDFATRATVGM
jgi:hypothetical protein